MTNSTQKCLNPLHFINFAPDYDQSHSLHRGSPVYGRMPMRYCPLVVNSCIEYSQRRPIGYCGRLTCVAVRSNCLIDSYRPNIKKIVCNIIEHKILWCSEYAGLASNRETRWSRPLLSLKPSLRSHANAVLTSGGRKLHLIFAASCGLGVRLI